MAKSAHLVELFLGLTWYQGMDDDVGADNRTVPGYVAKYFLTGYFQAFDGSANLLDCFPDDDALSNRMN